MIDFTCECGFKTQAKDELAGKKVKCPNCGRVVPVGSREPGQQAGRYPLGRTFRCACGRCGAVLVVPTDTEGQMVTCPTCRQEVQARRLSIWSRPIIGRSSSSRRPGAAIICPNPNCGYRGPCVIVQNGSTLCLILWFILGIVPGLIYAFFFYNVKTYCPQCSLPLRKEYVGAPSSEYRMQGD